MRSSAFLFYLYTFQLAYVTELAKLYLNYNLMQNTVTVVLLFCSVLICTSCRVTKNQNYFQDKTNSSNASDLQSYDNVIQAGDRLSIVVTALNNISAQPYNLIHPSPVNNNILLGYTVDTNGEITFPQLGKLKASGLTRNQLVNYLSDKLKKYLTDPVVTIEFLNFRVTVLGEVSRQGVINVPDGRITLLEAIGQSGDITIYGKKEQVHVVREVNGKREFGVVNLLSYDAFKSPYFKLQQNDVVYVEVNDKKQTADDQILMRNISIATSVVAVLSTLGLLIYNISR